MDRINWGNKEVLVCGGDGFVGGIGKLKCLGIIGN